MNTIEVADCPDFSCLTVKRVPKGSGHILCAQCKQPLWIIPPRLRRVFRFIEHYDSVPWDEYISETIKQDDAIGYFAFQAIDHAITSHTCQP